MLQSRDRELRRLLDNGFSKIDFMLDTRTIIQQFRILKSVQRLLFTKTARRLLKVQRNTRVLESGDSSSDHLDEGTDQEDAWVEQMIKSEQRMTPTECKLLRGYIKRDGLTHNESAESRLQSDSIVDIQDQQVSFSSVERQSSVQPPEDARLAAVTTGGISRSSLMNKIFKADETLKKTRKNVIV